MTEDLLSPDARFWELIGHSRLLDFDEAARRALEAKLAEAEAAAGGAAKEKEEEPRSAWLSSRK